MALTATTNTLPPAWDETIVPTLRKRLEVESRVLAKRISAVSISSDEAPNTYQYSTPHVKPRQNVRSPTSQPRPSAIPRPSMQQSRPNLETNGHVKSPSFAPKRARTLSQPSPFDPPQSSTESSVSRSVSPQSPSKPSRIPMKNRNGSVSSNTQSIHTAVSHLNGRKSKDTYYATDALHEHPPHNQESVISNEGSFLSANHADANARNSRLSSESDERPFEHWYRGEVSRNGGVGELRVARRKEMLDIASYGFASKRLSTWVGNGSVRSSSRSEEISDASRYKRRAESTGPSTRESFYMDREQAEDENMVLDERPPTDVEDPEPDEMSYFFNSYQSRRESPPPMPTSLDMVSLPQTSTRTQPSPAPITSRIPTPSHPRTSADSSRASNNLRPTSMLRGASEPLPSTSSLATQPNAPRARSQTPPKDSGPQTPKPQGKNMPSSSKANGAMKKSSKPPPVSMKRAKQDDKDDRRSIAVYPTPDGEDMENAIPVWTQPIENSNWDDVVLPVVARKKGLGGQYETAVGAARTRAAWQNVPEPAPGTFGYDHSKYKPPRTDYGETSEEVQMDEFGQQKETQNLSGEHERRPIGLTIDDHRPIHPMGTPPRSRPTSPAPFVHYAPKDDPGTAKEKRANHLQKADDNDDEAGCCKCLIM